MLSESENWKQLKDWAKWSGRYAQVEVLITGALLPILEALFVNLLTGAEPGRAWPFAVALTALGLAHIIFLAFILFREKTSPVLSAIKAAEAEERLARYRNESEHSAGHLRCEMDRRAECHRLIRSLVDDFNLQTCQINPAARDAFMRGVWPMIQRVATNIRTTLGVTSNEFTIELYCLDGVVLGGSPCAVVDGVKQELFYSPVHHDPCAPMRLARRAPHQWGLARGSSGGECRVEDDTNLFYHDGKPAAGLYFRRFATVPVMEVCSKNPVGVLVLTSKQAEPFSEDVLDTLQFLASLVTQYTASHNRCVEQWTAGLAREAKREQRQKREAEQARVVAQQTDLPPEGDRRA